MTKCASTVRTNKLLMAYTIGPIMGKRDVIHKTISIHSVVVEKETNHATDNMYRKYHEVWTCGF